MDTTNESPGRIQLRHRMLALQGPAVEALRKYYNEHALADSGRHIFPVRFLCPGGGAASEF